MQSFSIIIVSWNALNHLKTFLPSVVRTDHPRFEIILADNASTDESVEWVREHYPEVRIATLDQNYGYCGGNNRAAKFARYDNLIFLNNDVEVTPGWLYPIETMLNNHPNIAVVQPKLLSWEIQSRFEYAGAAGGFIDKHGYPFCRGRLFQTVETDKKQYDQDIPIFWASGAAFVIRKSVFTDLGGFEEHFEFHMEEIDLCWRVQRLGKEIWYCHNSTVYHLGGGSLSADNPRKTYYNFRNNLLMLARNLPRRGLLLKILMRLELDGLAGIQFLLIGKPMNMFAIIRAHFAFYGQIRAIRRFRNSMQLHPTKKMSEMTGTYSRSIIWNYYIKGIKVFNKLPGIYEKQT
jgi:GT2 family glycosyltransferase